MIAESTLLYIAIGIGLLFAINIGASGAAATMGAVYGSGAIKRRRIALILVALGAFAGAYLGSGEVVKTIGEGIIPTGVLTAEIVIVILLAATLTLFLANIIGIPLSTSEVTVGAIVGVGVAFQALYVQNILWIVSFWVIVPVAAFIISYVMGKVVILAQRRWPQLEGKGKWKTVLSVLLIATGLLEAFSAGMNNVANAIGPLIGAGMLGEEQGIFWGALFMGLGAIILGGRVLETNGKKITKMSLLQGSVVSGTGGTLVLIASLMGIPVPLTQATTSAIVGVGTAENGFKLWQKQVIHTIVKVWIVSPMLALVIAYGLIHLVLLPNPYIVTLMVSMLVATLGTMSLYTTIRKERQSIHDSGGGI